MKKLSRKTRLRLKIAFWIFVFSACLWVFFVPTRHSHVKPTLTVKVEPLAPFYEEAPMDKEVTKEPEQPPVSIQPVVPSPSKPKPAIQTGQKPKISIIIDDMGLDLRDSARALRLPAAITMSYIPYATRLTEQSREAHAAGHEVLLHMPMEPMGSADPGPGALLTSLAPEDVRQRFVTALSSFKDYDGVNNHMGSKFTAWREGMEIVASELSQRHLFFLDSRTSAQSVAATVTSGAGVPTLSRDVFLDDEQTEVSVLKQLKLTESIARNKGQAIAIGHPHPVTLEVLEKWTPQSESDGFQFVPLHDLLAEQK